MNVQRHNRWSLQKILLEIDTLHFTFYIWHLEVCNIIINFSSSYEKNNTWENITTGGEKILSCTIIHLHIQLFLVPVCEYMSTFNKNLTHSRIPRMYSMAISRCFFVHGCSWVGTVTRRMGRCCLVRPPGKHTRRDLRATRVSASMIQKNLETELFVVIKV